jgi:hypothetical protein
MPFDPYFTSKWKPLKETPAHLAKRYTHSGGLQLGRRFTSDGELKPNYSDGDIAQLLSSATVALLLLAHMFFVSMHRYEEMEEVRTLLRECHTDFKERLRSESVE